MNDPSKVTRLKNGARFEFIAMLSDNRIYGRYSDYTGEWCKHIWNEHGHVYIRQFAEFDLDWTSIK